MSNPAPGQPLVSPKPSFFTLRAAQLLFNLAFPQANRLTPHGEGLCISTSPQNPQSSGTCAPKALQPFFEPLLFWSPDSTINRREKQAPAVTPRPTLICQKPKGRNLQPPSRRGLTKTEREERKNERKWSVGENGFESERKLPDKHTAAPQLLITLRFRFQTL